MKTMRLVVAAAMGLALVSGLPGIAKADAPRGGARAASATATRTETRTAIQTVTRTAARTPARDEHRDVKASVAPVHDQHEISRGADRDDRHDDRHDRNAGDRDNHDWNRGRDFDRDHRVIVERPVIERPVVIAPVYTAPVYYEPDVDRHVDLCDVPITVLETERRESPGDIASVQFVRRGGEEFYRFIVSDRGLSWDLRVSTGGHFLGSDRC